MSDNYSSLEWYRQLSDSDKAYASTYGRSALIAKQKREAEAQQQQEQAEEVEETEPEEQPEEVEETETIEDPFFEQKQSQLEQKQEILDKLEKLVDEQTEFSDYLQVPEWREVLRDYKNAIEFVLKGYAKYFIQAVKIDEKNQRLHFTIEYYDKDGKEIHPVNPEVAVQSVEKAEAE